MVQLDTAKLLTLSNSQLIVIIHELVDKINLLETRIIEIEEKLKKTGEGGQKKVFPSFVKPNVKNKRNEKRKKRSQAFVRMKDFPTQTVFHSQEECPDCLGNLGKPSVAYSRQIIDIPITPAIITEHVIFKRYCLSCKKRPYPTPDLSSYVIGKYRIGINLMGLISTMRVEMRVPLETIQNHLKIFYSLKLSVGEIVKILHIVAGYGKKDYENIKQKLLQSPVIHADETGGRENGKNGYFWNFSNSSLQFLLYRKSRGSKVVQEVLGVDGKDYEGVVVSDFYAAYNEYAGFHQRCLVHYLRDIKALTEEYPKDKILKIWVKDIRALFEKAKNYTGPPDNLPIGLKEEMREEKEAYFKRQLTNICEPYIGKLTVFTKLNARALKYVSELFTFIRFPGILSDNNTAERAIRHLVVSRKISGGTRSSKGSETKSILASLFGTWRLQNLNPFEQTRSLLLQASCQRS